MIYRIAKVGDIPDIIKLHRKVLGEMGAEFLPRLGEECLIDVYLHLIKIEPKGIIVAQNSGVIGFIIGISDIGKMRKILPKVFTKAMLGLYDLDMSRFQFVSKGFRHLLYLIRSRKNEAKAELLDIVVDQHYQNRGIGTTLASLFFKVLNEKCVDKVQVLVDDRWKQAQAFYRKLDFKYLRLLNTPTGKMWVMVKQF